MLSPATALNSLLNTHHMFEGLLKNTIYIKIKQDWLIVRLIETKKEYQGRPTVVLDSKPSFIDGNFKVLAVVDDALRYNDSTDPQIKVANGFSHSRAVISDFAIAQATLRYFITKLVNRSAIFRPEIILHPLEKPSGGVSQDEVRMLLDLGIAAGGRRVMVWTGRELSDHQIENRLFPKGDGILFEDDQAKRSQG